MLVILIQLKGYQFLCSRDFLLPVVVNGHGSTVQVVENHDCFLFVNRFGVAENLDFHNKTFIHNLPSRSISRACSTWIPSCQSEWRKGLKMCRRFTSGFNFQFLAEYDVEMYLYHLLSEKLILSSQTALKQMGTGVHSIKEKLKAKLCRF